MPEKCTEADARWQVVLTSGVEPPPSWIEPYALYWRPGPLNPWEYLGNYPTLAEVDAEMNRCRRAEQTQFYR